MSPPSNRGASVQPYCRRRASVKGKGRSDDGSAADQRLRGRGRPCPTGRWRRPCGAGYATLIGYRQLRPRRRARGGALAVPPDPHADGGGGVLRVAPVWGWTCGRRAGARWPGARRCMAGAMLIYFGCLAFLPVAQVAAGLFTAPIFVLLIARFVYGQRTRAGADRGGGGGISGVILAVMPGPRRRWAGPACCRSRRGALRAGQHRHAEWCTGGSGATLTLGFFVALGGGAAGGGRAGGLP
jgi:hypothetical protein